MAPGGSSSGRQRSQDQPRQLQVQPRSAYTGTVEDDAPAPSTVLQKKPTGAASLSQPVGNIRPPLISMENLQTNMKIVMYGRSFLTIIAGVVAGILGLTGVMGFLCYVLVMGLCSLAFLVKAGFKPKAYVDSASRLTTEGFFGGMLSFILFWTLAYDIVHIF